MKAPSVEELTARIFDAFSGVRLDGGISLIEAELADDTLVEPDELIEEKDDWTKLINDRLCDFPYTFCFTDFRGYRFYIAPYMIWTLRNFRTSDALITEFTVYAIQTDRFMFLEHRFSDVFSLEQIKCMRDFLLFACENEDRFDGTVARENLERLLDVFPAIEKAKQASASNGG